METLKNIENLKLFDCYGALLTGTQNKVLSLILEDDLTLSEVADVLEISRQAVLDVYKKSVSKLVKFEEVLGNLSQSEKLKAELYRLEGNLDAAGKTKLQKILKEI